jgi:hypothetical protein
VQPDRVRQSGCSCACHYTYVDGCSCGCPFLDPRESLRDTVRSLVLALKEVEAQRQIQLPGGLNAMHLGNTSRYLRSAILSMQELKPRSVG